MYRYHMNIPLPHLPLLLPYLPIDISENFHEDILRPPREEGAVFDAVLLGILSRIAHRLRYQLHTNHLRKEINN